MTVQELMQRLATLDPRLEVMLLDSSNGGGNPRTLNLGPTTREIRPENDEATADCEGRTGEVVVVLGYGCY